MEQLTGVPTQYEVKRNYRFEFVFPEEFGIESWLIKSVTLPHFQIQKNGDNQVGYIRLSFINPIEPSTDIKLFNNFIIENKTNFECELYLLNSIGERICKWVLIIESILDINFGKLDYTDDSLNEITMNLWIDKAILTNILEK